MAGPSGERGREHRPALDGIRALAVIAVIAYHLRVGTVDGGFLGVGMFFVLSGYLITGLLLREHSRTGGISLAGFWARRIRRLYPALLLLVGAVLAYAVTVDEAGQLAALHQDLLSTLFYFANWHYAHVDQSYFAQYDAPSPLLHTWSLSIEEQFYVVWPLVVVLLLRAAHGRTRLLALVATVGVAGSVLWLLLLYDAADPSAAYFSTLGRAQDLLLGALLAIAAAHGVLEHRRAAVLAAVGLAVVAAVLVLGDDRSALYYRGGALVFALACVALIAGVEHTGANPVREALSVAPLRYTGRISYGLYLWHWPMIVWVTEARTGLSGLPLDVLRVGATFAVAALSWHLVEHSIQRGRLKPWLTPRRLAVGLPAASACAALLVLAATRGGAVEPPRIVAVAPDGAAAATRAAGTPAVGLVGDSVAAKLRPDLVREARRRGWLLASSATAGCAVAAGVQTGVTGRVVSWQQDCEQYAWPNERRLVDRYDPDVVVWYSGTENTPRLAGDRVALPGTSEHEHDLCRALEAAYRVLTRRGAMLVLVAVPPHGPVEDCRVNGESCELAAEFNRTVGYVNRQLRWLAERHPRTTRMISIDDVLGCDAGACPRRLGGAVVRVDGAHFSAAFAPKVARAILARTAPVLDAARRRASRERP